MNYTPSLLLFVTGIVLSVVSAVTLVSAAASGNVLASHIAVLVFISSFAVIIAAVQMTRVK